MHTLDEGVEKSYIYDGGDCVQERDATGSLTKQFIRGTGLGGGIGSILYKDEPSADREYFLYNVIGSTVATTNPDASVKSTSLYEAFGKVVASTGTSDNNRLFCTKERSASIGLDNFGFRYFDWEIGRFIQKDPLGYPDGLNNYLYCSNNPINRIDPLGLAEKKKEEIKPITAASGQKAMLDENPEDKKIVETSTEQLKISQGIMKTAGNLHPASTVTEALAGEDASGDRVDGWGNRIMSAVGLALPFVKALKRGEKLIDAEKKLDKTVDVLNDEKKLEKADLKLKYKESWTKEQRAAATEKAKVLTESDTKVVKEPLRDSKSASKRYKEAGGKVEKGQDVDHTQDLQLGGSDTVENMKPLDASVNRSLGSQIHQKIKDLPEGTVIDKVNIGD